MKRYFIIPAALLAFFLFSGKSCTDDSEQRKREQEEEAATVKQIQDIRSQFAAEYPENETLRAFEQKAIQKLMDYADLRNIANDTSLDSVFRFQAAYMMKEMLFPGYFPQVPLTMTGTIRIDSIRLMEPLHMTGDSIYTGTLGFCTEIIGLPERDTAGRISIPGTIRFITVKTCRESIIDTLRIWKVFLGDSFMH